MTLKVLWAIAALFVITLYPNGEVTVSRVREKPLSDLAPAVARLGYSPCGEWIGHHSAAFCREYISMLSRGSALSSSNVRNLRTPSRRNGGKGITKLGKRRVRNVALLLERKYGKSRLSFLTLTLPPCVANGPGTAYKKAVHRFSSWLGRRLLKEGLSPEIVGVTEVQERRLDSTGVLALHEHWTFPGRARGKKWAVSASDMRVAWTRALENAYGVSIPEDEQGACVNVQRVKRSVSAYLGKYLTKGVKAVKSLVEAGYVDKLPGQWFTCSKAAKTLYDSAIVKRQGPEITSVYEALRGNEEGYLRWHRDVTFTGMDGHQHWCAWTGYLTSAGEKALRELLAAA